MAGPLISVITPCLNADRFIAQAIDSVIAQGFESFEHVVVDGGSRDGTLDVLARYPHLRWYSGPDRGQSDAMNKGFATCRGQIIVYLNADDYFETGAFRAVLPRFAEGADFVVGRVKVLDSRGDWINDPKVGLEDMLKWWQPNAYCYNPVGYFYRREVQDAIGPFNLHDHYTMDFEFLIEAARRYAFTKISDILGCFRLIAGTKTFENSPNEQVTFRRFRKYVDLIEPSRREEYRRALAAALGEPQ